MGLDAVQDFLFQHRFIRHPALRGEESIMNTEHGVILQKFLAEQDFIDLLAVEPGGPVLHPWRQAGGVICCFIVVQLHSSVKRLAFSFAYLNIRKNR